MAMVSLTAAVVVSVAQGVIVAIVVADRAVFLSILFFVRFLLFFGFLLDFRAVGIVVGSAADAVFREVVEFGRHASVRTNKLSVCLEYIIIIVVSQCCAVVSVKFFALPVCGEKADHALGQYYTIGR